MIKEYAKYYAVKSLLGVSTLMPRSMLYGMAQQVVDRSFAKGGRREARVIKHLSRALFDESKEQLQNLLDEYRWHKAQFYTEMLLMLTKRMDYTNSIINLEEARQKLKALRRANRNGILFLASHYGNWEFLGQFLAINNLPATAVAKEQSKHPLIDERIILRTRQAYGQRIIKREGALRHIAKILKKERGVIGMHIDQMIPPPNGIDVQFFGQRAYASKSMAQMKLKFDPLMVPIFAIRKGRGHFRILIEDPIDYKAEEISDYEEKIRAITQRYTDVLERRIRKEPAQWEWYYQRWRAP